MWEKKKMLVTSIFSFSNNVFKRFPFQDRWESGFFGRVKEYLSVCTWQIRKKNGQIQETGEKCCGTDCSSDERVLWICLPWENLKLKKSLKMMNPPNSSLLRNCTKIWYAHLCLQTRISIKFHLNSILISYWEILWTKKLHTKRPNRQTQWLLYSPLKLNFFFPFFFFFFFFWGGGGERGACVR